jgi:hypothetical protein
MVFSRARASGSKEDHEELRAGDAGNRVGNAHGGHSWNLEFVSDFPGIIFP